MKLSTSDGAPALPEVTLNVEEIIRKALHRLRRSTKSADAESLQPFAARPGYLEDLSSKINFDVITPSRRSLRL